MFTGIIEGQGRLFEKRPSGGGMVFGIEAGFELTEPREGESIAVNGVCLTARGISGRRFLVDVSPESLTRTKLGSLSIGAGVNLERAVRLSDRLGGHLVSGHVDAVSRVLEKKAAGAFTIFRFSIEPELGRYIIEKGSIAIDGISLTVNSCEAAEFSVSIIPHTLSITSLGQLMAGDTVNIEVDLIGKYVEKLLRARKGGEAAVGKGIDLGFLSQHGFN